MNIRLEVGKARSPHWASFVRLAKKQKGYRVEQDDGLEIHVMETNDPEVAMALWDRVNGWKTVEYYLDGRLVSRSRMWRIVWDLQQRTSKLSQMCNEIVGKKQAERDRAEQERRWRMGL